MTRHENLKPDTSIEALLTGLANVKRLEIIRILVRGEVSVGTLASMVSLSQSALSQHLKKLRDIEIVTARRDGQNIYYSCAHPDVARLGSAIDDLAKGASIRTTDASCSVQPAATAACIRSSIAPSSSS